MSAPLGARLSATLSRQSFFGSRKEVRALLLVMASPAACSAAPGAWPVARCRPRPATDTSAPARPTARPARQDAWAPFEAAAGPSDGQQRRVRLGHSAANPGFADNSIRTSKYNILTFLPIFLFTMFSRVAYLYFAAQVLPRAPLPLPHRQTRGRCLQELVWPARALGSTPHTGVPLKSLALRAVSQKVSAHHDPQSC